MPPANLTVSNIAIAKADQHKNRRFFFTMIAAVAEMERGLMAARTRDGIAAARARGRFGGRPPKLSPTQKEQIRKLYNARELTVKEIAGLFNITPPTVYRALGR